MHYLDLFEGFKKTCDIAAKSVLVTFCIFEEGHIDFLEQNTKKEIVYTTNKNTNHAQTLFAVGLVYSNDDFERKRIL